MGDLTPIVVALNRRLLGHYNYYGVRGNFRSLWWFYQWSIECAFKRLNRPGGKRKTFTLKVFRRALQLSGVAKPRITEEERQHVAFAREDRSRESEYD